MGVWIEIPCLFVNVKRRNVTPLVGVWIEIATVTISLSFRERSLPLWECGLKCLESLGGLETVSVTPLVGVWIEILHRIHRRGHC